MSNEVFEEMQGAAGGAKAKLEKQARQLAYDTKYKVKQALAAKSGGKADPATVSKMYIAQLSKSPAPPAVKALAKKKLLGEEYVDVREFAVDSVTNALLKVFVEKKEEVVEEVIEEEKTGEKKYHVKVTDKKTGNSYHRYATRAKIAELRANPNIASVEMSHYGEGETKKAKKDYDGDGKVESSSKEHAGAVHNAIQRKKGGTPDGQDTRKEEVELDEVTKMGVHSPHEVPSKNLKGLVKKAVKRIDADNDGDVDTDDPKEKEMGEFVPSPDGKKKIKPIVQKEDFLSDWRDELFEDKKKDKNGEEVIDVMKGTNKITVSPEISEKMNLAKADMGDVVKDFYKSDAPQFKGKSKKKRQQMAIAAKLTAERGGKKLGEECGCETCPKCGKSPCECDKGGEDPRAMKTKANLVRNKLRAMGLKMSYEPEDELVEAKEEQNQQNQKKEEEKGQKETIANIKRVSDKKVKLDREKFMLQKKGKLPLNMSNEVDGDQLDEGIPIAVGAGLVGAGLAAWKAHQGMQTANKMKQDAASGKGVAGSIQRATDAKNKALQMLNQGTEYDGDAVIENIGSPIKLKPGSGLGGGVPVYQKDSKKPAPTGAQLPKLQTAGYEPEGEVIDERTRERKGQPRPARNRATEMMRKMPEVKKGLMTRGGRTVAQHEKERGVSQKDRPQPKQETTADRLEAKKRKAAIAKAAAQRSQDNMSSRYD